MPDKDNKVPLGKPLPLSDDELDELSKITPEDIKRADELFKEANPDLPDLLHTTEVTE